MNVAVVYGGKSGEHEISLVSASSVVRNINKNHKVFLIGISKSGEWFLQDESQLSRLFAEPDYVLKIDENLENQITLVPGGGTARAFCSGGKNFNVDVIFPVLHGTFGEDGTVQGLFELLEIPYVGASTISSAVTMDKEKTKAVLMNAGIPVVPGIMPVTSGKQIPRITKLSGCCLPPRFKSIADKFGDDNNAMTQAGIAYATDQVIDLFANGISHVHIYSMNKPEVAQKILENLSCILK